MQPRTEPISDARLQRQPVKKRHMISRLLLITAGMLIGMTLFESVNQVFFPEIAVWQLHIVTIFFSTGVAVVVAFLVTRRTDLMFEQISEEIQARRQTETDLRLSKEKLSKIFHANPDWIIISSLYEGRYIDINDAFCRMTGYKREEIIGKTSLELNIWAEPDERKEMIPLLLRQGRISDHEVIFRMKSGEIRHMLRSAELIDLDGEAAIVSVSKDITERIRLAADRERLIDELEHSLSKVKLLSGMLPICASCKKIRDDKGYWLQIESYLRDHSEAVFTHGLCPDCADKLFPGYDKKDKIS